MWGMIVFKMIVNTTIAAAVFQTKNFLPTVMNKTAIEHIFIANRVFLKIMKKDLYSKF
jgi:hypothetical protein